MTRTAPAQIPAGSGPQCVPPRMDDLVPEEIGASRIRQHRAVMRSTPAQLDGSMLPEREWVGACIVASPCVSLEDVGESAPCSSAERERSARLSIFHKYAENRESRTFLASFCPRFLRCRVASFPKRTPGGLSPVSAPVRHAPSRADLRRALPVRITGRDVRRAAKNCRVGR